MFVVRPLILSLVVLGTIWASAALAQVQPNSETVLKNQIIVTISDPKVRDQKGGRELLEKLRTAISRGSNGEATENVDFLFPQFCSLVDKNGTSSLETHLKLLNEGITAWPNLSESRMQAIRAYLRRATGEFCNQFVVTLLKGDAKEFADRITRSEIGSGLVLEELNTVHSYRIKRSELL